MADEDLYSTIRRRPAFIRKNARFISSVYESLLRPNTMLAMLAAAFALIWSSTPKDWFEALVRGDSDIILYFLMVAFTVLTGARLIQSIYLASRDYQSLETGLFDVLIFLIVIFFTGGAPLRLLPVSDIQWLALVYAVLAIAGVANFLELYRKRLKKKSPQIDYILERRIQAVNIASFSCVAAAMLAVFVSMHLKIGMIAFPVTVIVSTFFVLIANMMHSSQLTFRPKFLYTNDIDAPEKVIERFRDMAWRTSPLLTDDQIRTILLGEEFRGFQKVRLVRAGRAMADQIVRSLISEFGYIFGYVFPSLGSEELEVVLRCLVTSCGGFGALGFAWFYGIVDESGAVAGFIKLDVSMEHDLYRTLEKFMIPFSLVRILTPAQLMESRRRSRKIVASQPRIEHDEIGIAYILIKPELRRQGFASSTVRLLISAVKAQSNDVLAARLVILVRRGNAGALEIFRRLGFEADPERSTLSVDDDPFSNTEYPGAPTYMHLDLTKPPPRPFESD